MPVTAEIVDLQPPWKAIVASLAAGVGITLVFSLAVLGWVRTPELWAAGRLLPAALFGVVGVVGLAGALGGVVVGLVVAEK